MQIGSTQDLFNFAFPRDYKIPFDFLLFEARGQQQGDDQSISQLHHLVYFSPVFPFLEFMDLPPLSFARFCNTCISLIAYVV